MARKFIYSEVGEYIDSYDDGMPPREDATFSLSIAEAWLLSSFLQERMNDEESAESIGQIASKLYHFCRENPDL